MILSSQQIREAYNKLPDDVKDFITSNETAELISNLLKELGLSDEQQNLADSEILYAMYGLQSLDSAIENISEISNKPITEFIIFKKKINENIFDKYKSLGVSIGEPARASNVKTGGDLSKETNRVSPIVPENLPMIEPGETAHTVPHVEQSAPAKPSIPPVPPSQPGTPTPPPTPTQTPAPQGRAESSSEISPETKPKVSLPDYRYPEGADPYREPLK